MNEKRNNHRYRRKEKNQKKYYIYTYVNKFEKFRKKWVIYQKGHDQN